MTYTVAVYVRGRFIGWKDVQSDTVPEPINAYAYRPDPLAVPAIESLLGSWRVRNNVRATVGAEPVRLVLAEDK